MKVLARRIALAAVLTATAGLSLPTVGWAQFSPTPSGIPGAGNIATGRRNGTAGATDKPAAPAPDAIPGAKAREPAAPPTRAAGDMQPNEALFDAINRGDIASARDALNRGAELGAVNVLGMTPMELSVDLGRNDISFLLLSYRGEDAGRGSRASAHGAPEPAKTAKAEKPTAPAKPTKPEVARVVPPKPVAAPKLFANDGGAPLPSVGFLGFGTRQATN